MVGLDLPTSMGFRLAPIAIAALRPATTGVLQGEGAKIAQNRNLFLETSRGGHPKFAGGPGLAYMDQSGC
jgi:hypothetical protein